jgi:hypothetical protein
MATVKNIENVISTTKATILPNPQIVREQCTEECDGCNKMYSDETVGDVCIAYTNPKALHRLGCPLKSNRVVEEIKEKKINPIKASKKARKGK